MIRQHIFPAVLFGLSALFAIYGVCILAVNSGSRFYFIWFLLAGFMILCGADVRAGFLPAVIRRLLWILIAAGAAGIVITWGFIFTDFHVKGEKNLDCIIVLGAQVRPSGPSPVLRYRLDTAALYLKENPKTRCIVSGGKGDNEYEAEGTAMREYLLKCGIESSRIQAETGSLDTRQNLENSARLLDMGNDRIGIVTNNFHMFRALHIAKQLGYSDVCGIAAPSNPFFLPNNMLRESFGIVKDLVLQRK